MGRSDRIGSGGGWGSRVALRIRESCMEQRMKYHRLRARSRCERFGSDRLGRRLAAAADTLNPPLLLFAAAIFALFLNRCASRLSTIQKSRGPHT